MGSLFFNDDHRSEPEDLFGGMIEGAKLGLILGRLAVLPFLAFFKGLEFAIRLSSGKDDTDAK